MKKVFEPDAVIKSFQRLLDILDEPSNQNPELAKQFLAIVQAMATERKKCFSRAQHWELSKIQSSLEQKLLLIASRHEGME
jgi:hypothetical protein